MKTALPVDTLARSPVFIVGCSRGGTTLLQSILAAHDNFIGFPETNILYHALDDLELRRFGSEYYGKQVSLKLYLKGYLNTLGFRSRNVDFWFSDFLNKINRPDLYHFCPGDGHSMKQMFINFRALFDEISGSKTWIEKSPQNIFCLDYIERYFPDAKIIHIVRNGRDNIASLMDASAKYESFSSRFGGPKGLKKAITYWNKCLRMTEKYSVKHNHCVVLFDELIENPKQGLKRVEQLLSIHINDEMISYETKGIVTKDESWKFRANSEIEKPADKFNEIFNQEEKRLITSSVLSLDKLLQQHQIDFTLK